jgi:hypothetical protein
MPNPVRDRGPQKKLPNGHHWLLPPFPAHLWRHLRCCSPSISKALATDPPHRQATHLRVCYPHEQRYCDGPRLCKTSPSFGRENTCVGAHGLIQDRVAAERVHLVGDRLKVPGIAAAPHLTQMIQNQPLGYLTDQLLICEAVYHPAPTRSITTISVAGEAPVVTDPTGRAQSWMRMRLNREAALDAFR